MELMSWLKRRPFRSTSGSPIGKALVLAWESSQVTSDKVPMPAIYRPTSVVTAASMAAASAATRMASGRPDGVSIV